MVSKTLSKIKAVSFYLTPVCSSSKKLLCSRQLIFNILIILIGAGYNKACSCRTAVILSELCYLI